MSEVEERGNRESRWRSYDVPSPPHWLIVPLTGQLTGATSGCLTNFLSLIKYRQWGQKLNGQTSGNPDFISEIRKMKSEVGKSSFGSVGNIWTRGLYATVLRDSVFGSAFTSIRVFFSREGEYNMLLINVGAGLSATVLSWPLNYARNRQYSYVPGEGIYPSISHTMGELREVFGQNKRIFLQKLRIGWGSLRVGLGMAFGDLCFRTFERWTF